ncbi:MAG TPA: DUF2333 domain-containing protein, partial [Colwellia sp.]|nr:DUF2333 domain-containing protein [Colwellia sp.]
MKTMFSTKSIVWAFTGIFFLLYGIGVYWSTAPSSINIHAEVTQAAKAENVAPVVGYTTT